MNRRQPEPLRAPTPFCMPRSSDRLQNRLTATSETALHPTGRGRPDGDKEFARLARENFQAGFEAGVSNSYDTNGERPAEADRQPNGETEPLTDLITALTPRRFEVLELVARGLTNREIANVLEISVNTVKAHLAGILETLELTNRTEAAIALQDYAAGTRMTSR